MKYLIFTLSILFSTLNFGQDYIPVFEGVDSVRWNNVYYDIGITSGDISYSTSLFMLDSTIVDNGVKYRRFNRLLYDFLDDGKLLVREDTLSKKIYAKISGTENDFLIYDFDLTEGDTFNIIYLNRWRPEFYNPECSLRVVLDTMINYSGVERKTLVLKKINIRGLNGQYCPNGVKFIEGIGAHQGFEYFLENYWFTDTDPPYVRCAFKNGKKIYGEADTCRIDTFIRNTTSTDAYLNKSEFTISPNPVTDQILIKSNFKLHSGKIKVVNASGQVVFERTMEFRNEIRMEEIEKLSAGVYFLQIETEKRKTIKRFIKI